MDSAILTHFQHRDPKLFSIIHTISLVPLIPKHPNEYFVSLCNSIIGQQLSTHVADVIEGRFKKVVKRITPTKILSISDESLRNTGISWSKVRFIKDAAQKVIMREVDLVHISSLNDGEVVSELTKVKGIGPWTAEMFLIFTLGRPDIFSYGDLGLKRAIVKLYGLKKDPTVKQMQAYATKWKPYRTYAALALWKFKDG